MTQQGHSERRRSRGLMRRIGRRAGQYAEDSEGVSMVEFAFLFPILVMILLMLITLSHMMMIDRKVTITAQAAADLIAQRQAMEPVDVDNVRLAVGLMMQPFSSTYKISVAHVPFDEDTGAPNMEDAAAWRAIINNASQLTPAEVQEMADGTNIQAPDPSLVGPLGRPGDALIMLRMEYRYQSLFLGAFNVGGIGIPAAELDFVRFTYARPRLSRQITATNQLMSSSP